MDKLRRKTEDVITDDRESQNMNELIMKKFDLIINQTEQFWNVDEHNMKKESRECDF